MLTSSGRRLRASVVVISWTSYGSGIAFSLMLLVYVMYMASITAAPVSHELPPEQLRDNLESVSCGRRKMGREIRGLACRVARELTDDQAGDDDRQHPVKLPGITGRQVGGHDHSVREPDQVLALEVGPRDARVLRPLQQGAGGLRDHGLADRQE